MGLTKTQLFSTEQNELAAIAKVLGHPARIAILQHLAAQSACICSDLSEEIGLAQATISRHLAELKKAGLIQGEIEGTKMCYCLNPVTLHEVQKQFSDFLNLKTEHKINCDAR